MNKIKFSLIITILFFTQTQNVLADNIIINKINQIKESIEIIKNRAIEEQSVTKNILSSTTEEKILTKQEILNNVRLEIREKLDEQKIKFLIPFEQAIKNLKNLSDKIESRIQKMEDDGLDMTQSKDLVENLNQKINTIEIEIYNLTELLSTNVTPVSANIQEMEIRRNELIKIKSQTEKIKNEIKSTHKYLIEIIDSLKDKNKQ